MKYDKKIDIIGESRVSDGMGGWEVTQAVLSTVDAFTTPVKAEVAMREYGIVTTTAMKVFTKESIPNTNVRLKQGEINYRIIQYADFGKIKMILVEVIE